MTNENQQSETNSAVLNVYAELGYYLYKKIEPLGAKDQEDLVVLGQISYCLANYSKIDIAYYLGIFDDLFIWTDLKYDAPSMAKDWGQDIKDDYADILTLNKNHSVKHSKDTDHLNCNLRCKCTSEKRTALTELGCNILKSIKSTDNKPALITLRNICDDIISYNNYNNFNIFKKNTMESFFVNLASLANLKAINSIKANKLEEKISKRYFNS